MIEVSLLQILQLAPNARSSYRNAIANGKTVLDAYGISETPLRVAHFFAQVLHECGGLTIQFENLNYSAKRLPVVWPWRFKPRGPLDPNNFAHDPERLANEVYGGRMGNTAPGDGFAYRGRGLMQLTGKESYRNRTKDLRKLFPDAADFVQQPDMVISEKWCLAVAAAEWDSSGCNRLADQDDIRRITRAINGGVTGLASREEWARRTKRVWQ